MGKLHEASFPRLFVSLVNEEVKYFKRRCCQVNKGKPTTKTILNQMYNISCDSSNGQRNLSHLHQFSWLKSNECWVAFGIKDGGTVPCQAKQIRDRS